MNVLPKKAPCDMRVKFPGASSAAIDLVRGLLTVDPRKRLNTAAALAHPFLAAVREAPQYESTAGFTVATEDIESMELTDANLRRMMFQVTDRCLTHLQFRLLLLTCLFR